ncbi:MAG: NrsF family protein [Methylophagaceae bacterium]
MIDREQFISTLVDDVQAVKFTKIRQTTLIWLVGTFIFAALVAYLTGPYRSGIGHELLSSPQFLSESLIGVVSVMFLVYTAFDLSIPSSRPIAQRLAWPLILLAIWVSFYLFGLIQPALEPSMAGKREFCYYQTFMYSLPPLLVALFWSRKQWPLYSKSTGLLLGLAAGAVPALVMQFACMYDPHHILMQHILPGLSVGLVGVFMGAVMLRTR